MKTETKIKAFQDIVRILRENPEWMEEMRRLILTDEIMNFPKEFDEFKEEEFKPLRKKVDKIENDVEVLKEDVKILKEDVKVLKEDVKKLKDDVGNLKGESFERKLREKAPTYFGKLIIKCKVLGIDKVAEILEEAEEKGIITENERERALLVDLILSGFLKGKNKFVFLAVEVSNKIDLEDVNKAYERSKILSKCLKEEVVPVCIGIEASEEAKARAEEVPLLII